MSIAEFPGIRIDDFKLKPDKPLPCSCFLTHMHEDHTAGLARKSYYGPHVYCTAATRALLLNFRSNNGTGESKYNHLRQEICGKEIVKVLELNRPYEMNYRDTKIQVTSIDANHCPGAAMVSIQPLAGHGTSVLFTGDLRCEKWHLDSLEHHPASIPYLRKFSESMSLSIYLDNTFESHANPYKPYPKNYTGIKALLNSIDTYPPEVQFCLADRVTGYEEVLIAVAQHSQALIHMDVYHYNSYMLAADSSMLAKNLLQWCTIDLTERRDGKCVRIHYCQKNFMCPARDPHAATAYFKPCNQPTQELVDRQNRRFIKASIPPCVMAEFTENPQVLSGPDQRYYHHKATDEIFPSFPWFYFSRHASFPEIKSLCDMFHTCSIRSLTGEPLLANTPIQPSTTLPMDYHFSRSGDGTSQFSSKATKVDIEKIKIPAFAHSTLSFNSESNKDYRGKRVISMVGGEVHDGENLPIIKKRQPIALYHDRKRMQKARERISNYSTRIRHQSDSDHELSSIDSEDEEENHRAMMALGSRVNKQIEHATQRMQVLGHEEQVTDQIESCNQNPILNNSDGNYRSDFLHNGEESRDKRTENDPSALVITRNVNVSDQHAVNHTFKRSLTTTNQRTTSAILTADACNADIMRKAKTNCPCSAETHPKIKSSGSEASPRMCEANYEEEEDNDDEATLPSPPTSPLLGIANETMDEKKESDSLIVRLRENPSHWFRLRLECLNKV